MGENRGRRMKDGLRAFVIICHYSSINFFSPWISKEAALIAGKLRWASWQN